MTRHSRRHFLGSLGIIGGSLLGGRMGSAHSMTTLSPDFRPRKVARIVTPLRTQVGEVFKVRRTIPLKALAQVDPFLLLDHFDFTLAAGELGGLAPHPHRGFETVTVLFEGAIEHGDSLGNRGRIESGDVQWMTAGGGIVHEENPDDHLRARGGRILGIQLWVNLPRALKMTPAAYQDTVHGLIPVAEAKGVRARIIAGHAHGVQAVIGTHSPMALIDYTLKPRAEVSLAYPQSWTACIHGVHGAISVGESRVEAAHLALLAQDGGGIHVRNPTHKDARFLLAGGEAIGEPIARHGPFVMNTQGEIQQAIADYRSGRMGRVPNPTYDRIRKSRP
jgi:redox-sensitive bicupin YhaK (pirin superfamily)